MDRTIGRLSDCGDQSSLAFTRARTLKNKALLILILFTLPAANAWCLQSGGDDESRAENAKPLKVSGSIISVRLAGEDERTVKVRLSVSVVAQNAGQEALILLKDTPVSNAEYLFASTTAQEPLWMASHPASVDRNSTDRQWHKLQTALDQKDAPDALTITLNPGETIAWSMIVMLNIPKAAAGQPGDGAASGVTWGAIRRVSPCWLKIDLDFWPMSVEPRSDPENTSFAKKLFKRWRKKGRLIFTEKQSESIQVKLDGIGG